jgi:syntaxin 5|mmetsp:Transcript_83410/g.131727  ORF Transcript_83410/g.131727 Transcript_83410/m.131727 type:complete len:282 (+) Transcript_83410:85-930(+)|eukprot:CAMPEP_0169077252 /NCGR_PEP_ID=MMETSP1015-20121227/8778_1 /TAXON_ID=342587 /ORGANISM="Karlodinium micrum, Strain CCMP2283" /LENGTH=281 /DNA_ID=CAMNT_0009136761 /DNA_START=54 /DNA_END=899 /DNA_ORIENTATION=-
MGVVDRTQEFRNILQDLARKSNVPALDFSDQSVNKEQSVLNAAAAELGSEIHKASLKVQELRKMAKKKGIFQDQTHDIQVLTFSVKEDIQNLSSKIEALEKHKSTGPNRVYQTHSSNMIDTLKTRILEVTKDFKDALEDRTKTMASQDARKKMYNPSSRADSNPFAKAARPSAANLDDAEGGGAQAMTQMYTNSRAEAVVSVQKTIGELATMFQKMAVMVTAQEEMIQRIDHDIDETGNNMDNAQESLLKYFHHISSNRSLIIKVFLILIFFVIFFVVFIA